MILFKSRLTLFLLARIMTMNEDLQECCVASLIVSGLHKSINMFCLRLILLICSLHVVLLSEDTLISLCNFCIVQFLSHCELIDLEMTSGTHLFSLKYISDQIGTFHLLSSIGDPALKFCFRLSSLKHSNILVEEHVMV